MTLVEYDETIEVFSAPLKELLQSTFVLSSTRRFAYECRIRAEDHAFLHITIHPRRYLGVLEFIERMNLITKKKHAVSTCHKKNCDLSN